MQAEKVIIEVSWIPLLEKPRRLSDVSAGIFNTIPSRKGMKKAIDKGRVLVSNSPATTATLVKGGEEIALLSGKSEVRNPLHLKLEVLFEDKDLAVINKPAGLLVSGNQHRTVRNALTANLQPSPVAGFHPEPVHRLDFPTSGALLIGKSPEVVATLNRMFAAHQIEKHYLAVVAGSLPQIGEITLPVDDKPAHTAFVKLREIPSPRFEVLTLLQLMPQTGRRHQLRKHLQWLGHPILGDRLYGAETNGIKGKGLFLHAFSLRFVHPVTNDEVIVSAPIPRKFEKLFV